MRASVLLGLWVVACGGTVVHGQSDGGAGSGATGGGGSAATGGSGGDGGIAAYSGYGGDGGVAAAGFGGTPSGGGTGGVVTGLVCGGTQCTEGWKIGGLIDMPGCCTAAAKCGAKTDATIQAIIGLNAGCHPIDSAGTTDCGCPSMVVINPIDQAPVQFNGCCRPDGLCGYAVNTANLSGPNLGCTSASAFGGPAVKCTPGSETPPPASADGGPGNCAVSDGGIPN